MGYRGLWKPTRHICAARRIRRVGANQRAKSGFKALAYRPSRVGSDPDFSGLCNMTSPTVASKSVLLPLQRIFTNRHAMFVLLRATIQTSSHSLPSQKHPRTSLATTLLRLRHRQLLQKPIETRAPSENSRISKLSFWPSLTSRARRSKGQN